MPLADRPSGSVAMSRKEAAQGGGRGRKPKARDEQESLLLLALQTVLVQSKPDIDYWNGLAATGASDKQIRAALTFRIGTRGRNESRVAVCHIGIKPRIAFWLGSYGVGPPRLEGDELIARVRESMNIPPPG